MENHLHFCYAGAMNRAAIIAELKALEPRLCAVGVRALFLFGSCARDEDVSASDIDIFIDPIDPEIFGLQELIGAHDVLQNSVGVKFDRRVDFGTRLGLDKYVRPAAEKDAIRAF